MSKLYPTLPGQELDLFFSHLAPAYEWQTHALTMLSDQRWRRFTVACIRLAPGDWVLDMATGTGQLARLAARHRMRPKVVAIDSNQDMLELAQSKSTGLDINYLNADARHTPFAPNTFTAITMGFGLRILPEREKLLAECLRLLKPGGRIYFLETAPLYGWRRRALALLRPWLPGLLKRLDRRLLGYSHLLESMLDFPSLEQLHKLFVSAGFVAPLSYRMRPSLAHLHIAEKP